ncbi:pollen-specific protein C13-like [Prosopis cineraria]|uniref:pollen-specific protein C13-like n=1 Tax=Prosopis cineraria TaxID=364024 RepID=UPI0024109370|nr:pollen-specific protein C13-like [Prosopis cineraria]
MASGPALLFLLCVLPSMVAAIRLHKNPFCVQGRVYCDACRAGFETSVTTYIPGAEVIVECKDRNTAEVMFSKKGVTDSTGTYKIFVNEDHEDHICNAKLVSSPQTNCQEAAPGRDEARVILTRNNGIASDDRFANSLGYMKTEADSGCAEILRQYQVFDEEN